MPATPATPATKQSPLVYARRERLRPAEELRRLSAGKPVTRIDVGAGTEGVPVWLVTGYAEVRQVLGDHRRFSTRRRFGSRSSPGRDDGSRPDQLVGHLMDYDPPEHTQLRQILAPEFTLRRIRRLEPRIVSIVTECLDAMERARPPIDLVAAFADPVPGAVLCELIGVARDDRGDFLRRCQAFLAPDRARQRRAAAGEALSRYLAAMVARRRQDPDDSFLGMLVRDHGDEVTDNELRGVCVLLVLAGLENISGMLSLGTLVLLDHPDQLAAVRDDPEAVDGAVEELLRYLSTPHAPTPRTAIEDVIVGDELIRAGEHVICSIPMANLDTALLAEPHRLDITREPAAHVAFGHGIHHCLGAALARIELRIAYPALLRRFPGLRPAVPEQEVLFRVHAVAYGVDRLPVAW